MRVNITVTANDGTIYRGEAELSKATSQSAAKAAKRTRKNGKSTTVSGAAGAIKQLYDEHFLKNEKTLGQVMKKLSERGFNFDVRLVSMALYRSKYLTKKGVRGSYTFVQKHPPG